MGIEVGQRAQSSREVTARDIELFTELTGDRNPLHYDKVRTITNQGGTVVLDGEALVWQEPI